MSNVVLNELDWWVDSQWHNQWKVMRSPLKPQYNQKGHRRLSGEYRVLRKTSLKEMYTVRYADDFKIFCKTTHEAVKIKMAVTEWLSHRLKLQVSEEKTRITNLKQHCSEFLGFKFKMQTKGKKQIINAQMSDKSVKTATIKLKDQIKLIQKPENESQLYQRVNVYNSMVVGIQNYYGIANKVCINLSSIQWKVNQAIKNRFITTKQGKINNSYLAKRYGKSKQVRWISGIPIMPIGYHKSRNPMSKKSSINQYTPEGRKEIHNKHDGILEETLHHIMRNPVKGRSIEYNDNRTSLYVDQQGKCAINNSVKYGILASSCVKISVDPHFDYRFFYYIFVTDQFNESLKISCTGTTRDKTNLLPFSKLNIVIPPISE